MRIAFRILLGYFLIVALAGLLLARVFLQEVKPGVRQTMEDTLVDTANLLAAQARDDLVAGRIAEGRFAASVRELAGRDPGAAIWGFAKRGIGTRIYVTDARGIVVFDSTDRAVGQDYSRWNDVYLTLRGRYGARSTRSDPADEASTVMHVAAPIVDRRDGTPRIVGVLTVAKPNQAMDPFIARSQQTILGWGLVLLGVALAIGLVAAWWLSRQLGALRGYADAVTAGERVQPPSLKGEFGDLGQALATMRDRLEGKQYVEQYVHALTHELKSPLAAIRSSAELVESTAEAMPAADRARFLATIRAQGDRMAEMIDKMLALAAVEHRQRLERPGPVDLLQLAEEALAQLRPRLEARGIEACIDAAGIAMSDDAGSDAGLARPRAIVQGDAFLLRLALVNLLENAADFAPRGGHVGLRIARQAARWRIEVTDDGPGIPDYALPRAFERFYSLPRPGGGSRSSGLGLCLVAEVAALHGGEASLANREGGGAIASIVLPA